MELSRLGGAFDLSGMAADRLSKAKEERLAKRLSDMQDAIKRLQAMPSAKELAKQEASRRVGMLKQRLEALKAMLLHASPELARALAKELKSIAKELSAAAQNLGGGNSQGGSASVAVTAPAAGNADASAATATEQSAVADSAASVSDSTDSTDVAAGASVTPSAAEAGGAEKSGKPENGDGSDSKTSTHTASSRGDGDQDLRALLQDAKKLLKEVVAMMKAKLAHGAHTEKEKAAAKEAARDMHSTEKSLANLENTLVQGGGDGLYTAFGASGLGFSAAGLSDTVVSSGGSVDVRA